MISFSPKAFVVVFLCGIAAATLASISFQKRSVTLNEHSGGVVLSKPSVFGQLFGSPATLVFESRAGREKRATILNGVVERPIALLPGPTTATVLCVYDFDVGYRLIAFDLDGSVISEDDAELKVIVPVSEMTVRHATAAELAFALSTVRTMPNDVFRKYSIPTLDVGFLEVYAPRGGVLTSLGYLQHRAQD